MNRQDLNHTCAKCEACGKASYEQLMACDACQEEVVNKIVELENDEFERMMVDGGETSDTASGEVSVHNELPRMWRILAPRADNGRHTSEWAADTGNERGGAS